MYAPLVPVLLSLNLSFCLFFTSLLHQSLFFPSHLDKVLLQIFPIPFLVPWTYLDTFHCLWFWTPWGICLWPTCSASTLSWTCSTHSSLPQLTPQSWLRYNLSAGVVTFFPPTRPPKEVGGDLLPQLPFKVPALVEHGMLALCAVLSLQHFSAVCTHISPEVLCKRASLALAFWMWQGYLTLGCSGCLGLHFYGLLNKWSKYIS